MNLPQEIAACVFLYNSEGKLFIAKRAATKKFLPNKYELVGGRIEYGETIEEGLKRECREELHVEVTLGDPVYVFTYVSDGVHTVEVIYLARLADDSQQIQLNAEDHSESRWISEEEIDTFFVPDDEETKAVRKGFEVLKKHLQS